MNKKGGIWNRTNIKFEKKRQFAKKIKSILIFDIRLFQTVSSKEILWYEIF